ncbi:MAG: hypothetical protein AAF367_04215 [Pseudomonadota bacterium]
MILIQFLRPIAFLCLSGCAVITTTPDGGQRIIGFVDMSVAGPVDAASTTVGVRSFGVLAYDTPEGAGLSVGLQEVTVTSVADNVIIPHPFSTKQE